MYNACPLLVGHGLARVDRVTGCPAAIPPLVASAPAASAAPAIEDMVMRVKVRLMVDIRLVRVAGIRLALPFR